MRNKTFFSQPKEKISYFGLNKHEMYKKNHLNMLNISGK